MSGFIAASALYGWSFGGSILTFALPMLLFIAVASTLYVLFTKPHPVPGHRYQVRAVITPMPGKPPETNSSQAPPAGARG